VTDEFPGGQLLAVSDLHTGYSENQAVTDLLRPRSPADWLIVAGDVAERAADVIAVLARLRERFSTVVWAPGNHELWTHPSDPVTLRGEERYQYLVAGCREIGVRTPEDQFAVWDGPGGPVSVAPVFALYDYSFRVQDSMTVEESLAGARAAGIVCTDETFLHPDPYPDRASWCRARIDWTEARLSACDPAVPLVLVSHWPLIREPTRVLRHPEFAQWCGTTRTAQWHHRFNVEAVVYGHLHIPRTTVHDGVPFHEVSLGYPREWRRRGPRPPVPKAILPAGPGAADPARPDPADSGPVIGTG
jgi:3',5'-cyclic AMP phosphodiesterase CpdA